MNLRYRVSVCPVKSQKVVATIKILEGEVIGYLSGKPREEATIISIFLNGRHIDPDNGFQFINHSCSPNSRFDCRKLIAISTIAEGEEITFNYKDNEPIISHPFKCFCGSPNCIGFID